MGPMICVPKAEEEGRTVKDLMTEEAAESQSMRETHIVTGFGNRKGAGRGIQPDPRGWNSCQLMASKLMETSVAKSK